MKYIRVLLLKLAIFGLSLSSVAGSNKKKEILSEPTMTMTTESIGLASIYLQGTGTAVIDWGDGKKDVINFTQGYNNHQYADSAPRTITITGNDITVFYCSSNVSRSPGNRVISLDVGNNIALTNLGCSDNLLTSLDVSKNTALISLGCVNNQLTSLDMSKNTALTNLSCYNNQLDFLDVSNNTALTKLRCYNNLLTSLNVSKNTALEELHCFNNQLTFLDVSNNTALKELSCYNNKITTLDASKNTALESLYCNKNQLTTLVINKNPTLQNTDFSDNPLTSLHIIKNSEFAELIKSDKTDPIERAQYKQKVYEIDAMQLICDTLRYRPPEYGKDVYGNVLVLFSGFKGIYFDEKGRLRKYFWEDISKDGSQECTSLSAFYDENGVLFFLHLESSYNCGDENSSYYIYQGRMIDFEGSEWCGCCEVEAEKDKWEFGKELPVFIDWTLLSDFFYAETLFKTLQSKDNDY